MSPLHHNCVFQDMKCPWLEVSDRPVAIGTEDIYKYLEELNKKGYCEVCYSKYCTVSYSTFADQFF